MWWGCKFFLVGCGWACNFSF